MHMARSPFSTAAVNILRQEAEAHKAEIAHMKKQLTQLDKLAQILGHASASDEALSKVAALIGIQYS